MKQNIFGVLLFSVIVGTAIFVSGSFIKLPTPPAVYERPVYESRTSCRKPKRNVLANIKVNQAVFNPRTNQLNTSLRIEKQNLNAEYIGVTYYFFVKDGAETRFIASETVAVNPDFAMSKIANQEIISSYSWLDKFDNQQNLYLMASVGDNGFAENKSIPRFDESNATPVLLMSYKK